jgi:hypothetical protein
MIRLTTENTQRAIEKCKQLKPTVKFIRERMFAVQSANNSNVYQLALKQKTARSSANANARHRSAGLSAIT